MTRAQEPPYPAAGGHVVDALEWLPAGPSMRRSDPRTQSGIRPRLPLSVANAKPEGHSGPCYRFGEFELDCSAFRLMCAGEPQEIGPKVFDVLRYLVEHPIRLVSKHELLDALWPNQCVEEAAVPWAISHARRALRQRGTRKTPIETVYGRGYRFTAAVECVSLPQPAADLRDLGGEDPWSSQAWLSVEYSRLTRMAQTAAMAAMRAGAYEDAARFYSWAIEVQKHDIHATPQARAELHACLAEAEALVGATASAG